MRTKIVIIVLAFCCFQMALTSHLLSSKSQLVIDKIGAMFVKHHGVENDTQTPVVNGDLGYRACVEQDE